MSAICARGFCEYRLPEESPTGRRGSRCFSLLALPSAVGFAPAASAANTDVRDELADHPDGHHVPELRDVQGVRPRLQAAAERRSGLLGDRQSEGSGRPNGHRFPSGAATIQKLGTATTVSPYTYTGGPFIIDSANAAAAQPIINAWWAANANQPGDARDHGAARSPRTSISILRSAPRIALEAINAGIAIAYFNAAGIPDGRGAAWSALSPNILNDGLIGCNNSSAATCPTRRRRQRAVSGAAPAARGSTTSSSRRTTAAIPIRRPIPPNVGTQAYAELDNFVAQGGGWIALCHSILSNENNIVDALRAARKRSDRRRAGAVQVADSRRLPDQNGFPTISNAGGNLDRRCARICRSRRRCRRPPSNGLPGGSVQNWPSPFNAPPIAGAPVVLARRPSRSRISSRRPASSTTGR